MRSCRERRRQIKQDDVPILKCLYWNYNRRWTPEAVVSKASWSGQCLTKFPGLETCLRLALRAELNKKVPRVELLGSAGENLNSTSAWNKILKEVCASKHRKPCCVQTFSSVQCLTKFPGLETWLRLALRAELNKKVPLWSIKKLNKRA